MQNQCHRLAVGILCKQFAFLIDCTKSCLDFFLILELRYFSFVDIQLHTNYNYRHKFRTTTWSTVSTVQRVYGAYKRLQKRIDWVLKILI